MFACALIPSSTLQTAELAVLQAGCTDFSSIVKILQNIPVSDISPRTADQIRKDFVFHGGVLYKKNDGNGRKLLLAVPPSLRRELIGQSHSSVVGGHLGWEKTLAKLNQRYFWPRMGRHVEGFVRTCLHCQFRKPPPGVTPGLLEPIRPPERPFQMVGIDHLGPISSSKEGQPKHIIVAVDYLSKWIEARAVNSTSSEEAADSVTKLSPFELVYGRLPTLPSETKFPWPTEMAETYEDFRKRVIRQWRTVRRRIVFNQLKTKKRYDRHHRANTFFEIGDLVMMRRPIQRRGRCKKFEPRFIGPLQILKRISPTTYEVQDIPSMRTKKRWGYCRRMCLSYVLTRYLYV